eukprot:tig00000254_g22564.t1
MKSEQDRKKELRARLQRRLELRGPAAPARAGGAGAEPAATGPAAVKVQMHFRPKLGRIGTWWIDQPFEVRVNVGAVQKDVEFELDIPVLSNMRKHGSKTVKIPSEAISYFQIYESEPHLFLVIRTDRDPDLMFAFDPYYDPFSQEIEKNCIVLIFPFTPEHQRQVSEMSALCCYPSLKIAHDNSAWLRNEDFARYVLPAPKLGPANVYVESRRIESPSDPGMIQILLYPPGHKRAVALTKRDFERLRPGEMLNDNVIDFYLKYIEVELLPNVNRTRAERGERPLRCHFFNSFFYTRLSLGGDPEGNYEAVRRWTRNVDIFTLDYLFIPVHVLQGLDEAHWALTIVCNPRRAFVMEALRVLEGRDRACIMYLSSMKTSNKVALDMIEGYLRNAWQKEDRFRPPRAQSSEATRPSSAPVYFTKITAEVPKQDSSTDGGVFVLEYIERFIRDPLVPFVRDKKGPLVVMKEDWFSVDHIEWKRSEIQELIVQKVGPQEAARLGLEFSDDDANVDASPGPASPPPPSGAGANPGPGPAAPPLLPGVNAGASPGPAAPPLPGADAGASPGPAAPPPLPGAGGEGAVAGSKDDADGSVGRSVAQNKEGEGGGSAHFEEAKRQEAKRLEPQEAEQQPVHCAETNLGRVLEQARLEEADLERALALAEAEAARLREQAATAAKEGSAGHSAAEKENEQGEGGGSADPKEAKRLKPEEAEQQPVHRAETNLERALEQALGQVATAIKLAKRYEEARAEVVKMNREWQREAAAAEEALRRQLAEAQAEAAAARERLAAAKAEAEERVKEARAEGRAARAEAAQQKKLAAKEKQETEAARAEAARQKKLAAETKREAEAARAEAARQKTLAAEGRREAEAARVEAAAARERLAVAEAEAKARVEAARAETLADALADFQFILQLGMMREEALLGRAEGAEARAAALQAALANRAGLEARVAELEGRLAGSVPVAPAGLAGLSAAQLEAAQARLAEGAAALSAALVAARVAEATAALQRQADEERAARQRAEQQQSLCVVCTERPPSVLLLPCRHMTVCDGCYGALLAARPPPPPAAPKPPACPSCRVPIDQRRSVRGAFLP